MRSCRAQRRSGPIIGLVACARVPPCLRLWWGGGLWWGGHLVRPWKNLTVRPLEAALRAACSHRAAAPKEAGAQAPACLILLACLLLASPTLADIKPIPLSPTAVAAGAQITYDKGIEFVTIGSPGNEMIPVGNISWRMAAMYANWLNNDQSSDRSAFLNGAYDVSTFTYTPAGRFRDQLTHNPDAKYWIPTGNL